MEKISSGLRINRSADDAAGLAISEKMKSQIRGLEQAGRNIQDGNSLIQVAEGGLSSITDQLQRMRELKVQSLNGTLTKEDTDLIQKEMNQISNGIDDIANNTEFNGKKLLNGQTTTSSTTTTTTTTTTTSTSETITANQILIYSYDANPINQNTLACNDITKGTQTKFKFSDGEDTPGYIKIDIKDNLYDTLNNFINTFNSIKNNSSDPNYNNLQNMDAYISNDKIVIASNDNIGGSIGGSTSHITKKTSSGGVPVDIILTTTITNTTTNTVNTIINTPISLQIGDKSTDKFDINLSDVTLKALGLDKDNSISNIDNAISKILDERSKCGAYQNALDHIYNNVTNTDENLTAANSKITDADIAKEMMELCKNNIIEQTALALLAQSNQEPNRILTLLK
jgi:flagellin